MLLIRVTAIFGIATAIAFLGGATEPHSANVHAIEDSQPQLAGPAPSQPLVEGLAGPTDDAFAEVARAVPAFAGMFLDGNGNLSVYLLDPSQKAAAEAAIASVFGADRFKGAPVQVLLAQFGFLELYQWRLTMRPIVLGIPGVVSLDIDETRNRVRVGVADVQVQAVVEPQLVKLRVPFEAVIFEVDTPVIPGATLQDRVRYADDTPGVWRAGSWFLTNTFGGPPTISFGYGNPTDIPLVGDWDGDGVDTPGVWRNGSWFLTNTFGGPATIGFQYGDPTDIPLVGDWNGDGVDTVGVWRGGSWFLTNTFGGPATISFGYGNPTDTPLVGDWDGNGVDTVGVWRGGSWYLTNTFGGPATISFGYGDPTDTPLAGDWDGGGVVGGLQIQRLSDGFTCTLGFNAALSGSNGFVTNSHCTNVQGGVESTVFYQPTVSSSNRIGVETRDGIYWTGTVCPPDKRCRWSDSAFVRYDSGISYTRGIIARTGLGSITISGQYRITAEVTLPAAGEILNKVGRTTGRTQGSVDTTCMDVPVDASDITLLCQNHVAAGVQRGDSGSPVFRITNSPATNDVSLYGVLWGADLAGFWFSSMQTIQFSGEVGGPLATCASGFSC